MNNLYLPNVDFLFLIVDYEYYFLLLPVLPSAYQPGDGDPSVSRQVVRRVGAAHPSCGAAGPEQHQLPASRCESPDLPLELSNKPQEAVLHATHRA